MPLNSSSFLISQLGTERYHFLRQVSKDREARLPVVLLACDSQSWWLSPPQTTSPETGKNWDSELLGETRNLLDLRHRRWWDWRLREKLWNWLFRSWMTQSVMGRATQNLCLQWGRRKGPVTGKLLKLTDTVSKRPGISVRPLWCFFCIGIRREVESIAHTGEAGKPEDGVPETVPLYWTHPQARLSKVGWYLWLLKQTGLSLWWQQMPRRNLVLISTKPHQHCVLPLPGVSGTEAAQAQRTP